MACIAEKFTPIADFIAPVNSVTGVRGVRIIPECAETALGSIMYPVMVLSEGGETKEGGRAEKIASIFAKLIPETRRNELPYEVKLLRKQSLNAWCLPGGKVAVYSLLASKIVEYTSLERLEEYVDPQTGERIGYQGVTSDDVFAALLGHEMTHADARHTARKLEWTGFLQACVFGVSAFIQARIASAKREISSSQRARTAGDQSKLRVLNSLQTIHDLFFHVLIKFSLKLYHFFGSRQHEFEADKYGMQLAVRAGYDWRGALYLQEILKRESGREWFQSCPSLVREALKWLRTHPSCEERQAAILEEAKLSRWI